MEASAAPNNASCCFVFCYWLVNRANHIVLLWELQHSHGFVSIVVVVVVVVIYCCLSIAFINDMGAQNKVITIWRNTRVNFYLTHSVQIKLGYFDRSLHKESPHYATNEWAMWIELIIMINVVHQKQSQWGIYKAAHECYKPVGGWFAKDERSWRKIGGNEHIQQFNASENTTSSLFAMGFTLR